MKKSSRDFEKGKAYSIFECGVEIKRFLCTHVGGNLVSFTINGKTILAKKWRMGNSEYSPEVADVFVGTREYRLFAK
jgi:hypothetical protein